MILFILRVWGFLTDKQAWSHTRTLIFFSSPQIRAKMLCPCFKVLVLHIGNPDCVSDYCKPLMLP